MPSITLISNTLCPYTQRAVIQLAEKHVSCEREYIDLGRKPVWFEQASPLGKVPLLRVNDTVVFETVAICEYFEETYPTPPLHPTQALERARHRGWIEFASAVIADVFSFYMAPDANTFAQRAMTLKNRFGRLERELVEPPYFAGESFGLVDAAFAPIFRLFDTFDRIGDFGIFAGLQRVPAYRSALGARESVRRAVVHDYGDIFEKYLATRDSHLAALMKKRSVAL